MVYNTFIKCQVCGSITRVRLQVGWREEHPIVVACGKCGTSLSGIVQIGQDHPELKFSFDNAKEIGCIHTSQGLELDYVGVIIGDDMRYENGHVITDFTKRAKTDQSLKGIFNFMQRKQVK